jgi:hypothetical protein
MCAPRFSNMVVMVVLPQATPPVSPTFNMD